jgi:hypothetical protein
VSGGTQVTSTAESSAVALVMNGASGDVGAAGVIGGDDPDGTEFP